MAKRTSTKTGRKRSAGKSSTGRAGARTSGKTKKSANRKRKATGVVKKAATRGTAAPKRRTTTSAGSEKAKAAGKKGPAKKVANRKANRMPAGTEGSTRTAAPRLVDSEDSVKLVEEQRRLPRTYLSAKELQQFKELLLHKRAELTGDVERLTDEALSRRGDGPRAQSSMPIHMADLGSDNWEQEFTLGLIANERAMVREIDEALARIESKTYGMCLATHNKIAKSRLEAKPWAKYCIEYARAREEGRVP